MYQSRARHCAENVMLSQPRRRSIWGWAYSPPPQIPRFARDDSEALIFVRRGAPIASRHERLRRRPESMNRLRQLRAWTPASAGVTINFLPTLTSRTVPLPRHQMTSRISRTLAGSSRNYFKFTHVAPSGPSTRSGRTVETPHSVHGEPVEPYIEIGSRTASAIDSRSWPTA